MSSQKYSIVWTTQFKKDYKRSIKRNMDISLLDDVIRKLSKGESLDESKKDHQLSGKFLQYREVHLFPDVLMIYYIEGEDCFFVAIGSHADLF